MKKALLTLIFASQIGFIQAAPLSKSVLESFKSAAYAMEKLEQTHPEIFKNLPKSNDMDIDMSAMVNYFQTSKISTQINSAITTSGFKDLNDFVDTSLRLTSASIAVSSQHMPMDAALKAYEQQLADAKKQADIQPEMIAMFEEMIQQEKTKLDSAQALINYASDADKKFLTDNAAWFAKMMEDTQS